MVHHIRSALTLGVVLLLGILSLGTAEAWGQQPPTFWGMPIFATPQFTPPPTGTPITPFPPFTLPPPPPPPPSFIPYHPQYQGPLYGSPGVQGVFNNLTQTPLGMQARCFPPPTGCVGPPPGGYPPGYGGMVQWNGFWVPAN